MNSELRRLRCLHELSILDMPCKAEYEALVEATARLCGMPAAALCMVDEQRVQPIAVFGTPLAEVAREQSMCAYAIGSPGLFIVQDTRRDERFRDSPWVTGAAQVVFYAAMPLVLADGAAVGSLAILDSVPRSMPPDAARLLALQAQQAVALLRGRRDGQRLQQTQQQLAEIETLGHVGRWEFDIDARRVHWSDEVFRILGHEPQTFVPTLANFASQLHPEDRPALSHDLAHLDAGDGLVDTVHRVVRPDGSVRHVHERGRRVSYPGSLGDRVVGTMHDVTAEHEAVDAMRQQMLQQRHLHERLRLACRLGHLGDWHFDVATRRLHWGEEVYRILGIDAHEEASIDKVLRLLAPLEREALMNAFSDCCRSGTPYDLVLQITSTSGRTLWSRSMGEAVRDADGQITRVQGAFQDVTDQVLAVERDHALSRRLQAALEGMGDAFCLLAPDSRVLYFNVAAERLLSCDRGAVLGQPLWEAVASLADSPLHQAAQESLDSGHSTHLGYFHAPQRRWHEASVHCADSGLAIYIRDVTQQHARMETWRLLAEAMPLIVWTALLDGSVDYLNPALARYAGVPIEALMREGWLDLVHPDDRPRVIRTWAEARARREAGQSEFRLRRADGVYRWHLARTVLLADLAGQLKWYGSTTDIDDTKLLQQAAQAMALQLATTMESITDAIFTLDEQWCFTFLNRQAQLELGRPREELLGRPLWQEFPGASGTRFQQELEHCVASRGAVHFEEVFVPLDKALEVSAYPSDSGVTVYFRDVTQRRRSEQDRVARQAAEHASQAKSEFLARVSHELRTPLNAILGFAQLMELDADAPLQGVQAERLHRIRGAGRHLLDMINEILYLTGIEAGNVQLNLAPVAIAPVVQQCLESLEPQAAAAGVKLRNGMHSDMPVVLADEKRLRQVLLNLLSNAVKYNRRGGWVEVSVRTDADRIRIDVADTGKGLSTQQLARLFQAFDRLGAERTEIEGTGLGLVISKGLTQLMQGDLHVAQREGGGSVFTLELRSAHAAAEPGFPMSDSAAPAPVATSDGSDGSFSLLYIEDEPVNALLVRQVLLARPQYRLHEAADGRSGVQLARELQPDLVLIDMNLPDMKGYEVLALLQGDASTAHLRCIALSADAMPSTIRAALETGFIDFWTKPIDVPDFLRRLDGKLQEH
ncbi:PAS domain-containing protein [Azohydromonas aeria]|uniref:PAS domain-containing protein n=1 Tax=Azohydromonas aeria TaxID=2590212 RepID=UPI0012F8CAEF|nr:PAS domain-containing protein [Azohydromonas aeria]